MVQLPMWIDGLFRRRPTAERLRAHTATLALRPLSYDTVGMSLGDTMPFGFRRTDDEVPVVDPQAAMDALHSWAMHQQQWIDLLPAACPIVAGADVAVLAQAAGLWWLAPSRIVAVVDEPHRAGFVLGTVEGHILTGEEAFVVEQTGPGFVFRITGVTRSSDSLASLGSPAIHHFQEKFVRGALDAVAGRAR